jgi:uncharacterized protein (DUF885 family)
MTPASIANRPARSASPDPTRSTKWRTSFTGMPVRRNRNTTSSKSKASRFEDATPAAVPVHRAKQPSSVVVVQSVDRQTRESRHVTNQQIVIVQASQLRKCRRCAHMTSLQPGAHSRSNSVLQSVSVLSMSRERTHSPALNEPHDEAVVSAAVQRITGKFDTRRR